LTSFKLYYFNIRGKAEVARLLFTLAGEAYEDFRFSFEDWPNHKPNTPYGQVPVLEITEDGKTVKLPESVAIFRFLANRFGFAGKTPLEKAQVDAVADLLNDMLNQSLPCIHEKDPVKQAELFAKYYGETVHNFFKLLEKTIVDNKTGFLVGDDVTFADLFLFNACDWMRDHKEKILAQYPAVKAHNEKVAAIPKIAEWLKVRPVTDL
jgi:glutathione S-transferase